MIAVDTSLTRRFEDEILSEHQEWNYLLAGGPARPPTEAELALYEQRRHDGTYRDLEAMDRALAPLRKALAVGTAPAKPEPAQAAEDRVPALAAAEKTPDRFLALHDDQDKREAAPDGTRVIPAVDAHTETFEATS